MKLLFIKSNFLKNSLILIGGTVLAQLIPLFLQLYLRRIYTPEDFGAFSIYFNLLSVFIIFCSLRYEAAVVLPKNDVESINVLSLSLLLTFSFGFFFLFFLDELRKYNNYTFLIIELYPINIYDLLLLHDQTQIE